MVECKICASNANKIFTQKVLKKYDVSYYQCPECLFIQTEHPYWLDESYQLPIASTDVGLLFRNIALIPRTSSLIELFLNKREMFLDYAGGYGVFVRLMRDKGYNFHWQDMHCENIFAKGFEWQSLNKEDRFELITAFEVFEHLTSPMKTIGELLEHSSSIFFSTTLQPLSGHALRSWEYIAPETGQHIAFYHLNTLKLIAQKWNINFYTNGHTLHLFTKKKLSPMLFWLASRRKLSTAIAKYWGHSNSSLLLSDYDYLKSKMF